jgi:hypothetical protein
MTPKEKAEELVHEFETTIFANFTHTKKSFAKQCALIAVNQIIEANGLHPNDTDYDYNKAEIYWQEVKREITR